MRKLFDAFLTVKKTSPQTGDGGFTSRGAKDVSGYLDTPPPPRKPTSGSGSDGNDNGGGSGTGGGNGPDFYCSREELIRRGHTEDVINTVTQSGILSAWSTHALNEQARQEFERKHPDKPHTKPYQENDYAFRGKSQPSDDDHKLLRFYSRQDRPGGEYHASMEEMQRKAQIRFNASSMNSDKNQSYDISVAVKRYFDIPGAAPQYSSEARFTPTVVGVEISNTISGKQQVRVEDYKEGIDYSNERDIQDLFSWLKFKPGG